MDSRVRSFMGSGYSGSSHCFSDACCHLHAQKKNYIDKECIMRLGFLTIMRINSGATEKIDCMSMQHTSVSNKPTL